MEFSLPLFKGTEEEKINFSLVGNGKHCEFVKYRTKKKKPQ
jgi:hypothetical protein